MSITARIAGGTEGQYLQQLLHMYPTPSTSKHPSQKSSVQKLYAPSLNSFVGNSSTYTDVDYNDKHDEDDDDGDDDDEHIDDDEDPDDR